MNALPLITINRNDYQAYPFSIPEVELEFDLDPISTRVHIRLNTIRIDPDFNKPLILNGEKIILESVSVNGVKWQENQYYLCAETLTLPNLGQQAVIDIVSYCDPKNNSTLSGIYLCKNNFFTQCEAESFRRIAWFADRPDIMSRYRVTIRADRAYPVLLSNGNLVATESLPDGRQQVIWQDPFPKPCYLFALVAGEFSKRETNIQTSSGRSVLLQIYSDLGTEDRTEWALASLIRALRWDEQRFGLELDLDRFMIVAVRDFNMGAMENKGLNIFNAAYVLANSQTATDANYEAIESVIGHEYFHNWTGNRVTCRDWFQLSLKEGLTVFRDQEFSADMRAQGLDGHAAASARAVKRIDDVCVLRAAQFPEDAGPMAHPIRPESYQEIGNFYTATVYEKGAEVIRMQQLLLGINDFRKGIDEYFRRYDGQAVTCDDFIDAMESVYMRKYPTQNLSIFRRWYSQAGTPIVAVKLDYDVTVQQCKLTLTQRCAAVGVEKKYENNKKLPFHIPFAIGLLDQQGQPFSLAFQGQQTETALLELTTESQEWTFEQITQAPIPSLLRDFSAPVIVEYPWTNKELALLTARDSNPFAKWEAAQELISRQILDLAASINAGCSDLSIGSDLIESWRSLLNDSRLAAAYRSRILALPSQKTLAQRMEPVDPIALSCACEKMRQTLGRALVNDWHLAFQSCHISGPYTLAGTGKRALKNLALSYLLAAGDEQAQLMAQEQYAQANNMTDRFAALSALTYCRASSQVQDLLEDFYQQWRHDSLVIDKWFGIQATALSTNVERIRELMKHPDFNLQHPNRARALIFQFCLNNPQALHQANGLGYVYWAEQVIALDALNPEVAARLARALENWTRFISPLRALIQASFNYLYQQPTLSRNVTEIVSKALEAAV